MIGRLSLPTRLLVALSGLAALVLVVGTILFDTYQIPSDSMAPAVHIDETVLVRVGQSPGREDIVIATPDAIGTRVIRRVVGEGGDQLSAQDGALVRNGEVVEEPYLEPGTETLAVPDITVPDETMYLLGDQRGASHDSRTYGPVPIDQIHGVVIYDGLPVDRIVLFATVVLLAASVGLVIHDVKRAATPEDDPADDTV